MYAACALAHSLWYRKYIAVNYFPGPNLSILCVDLSFFCLSFLCCLSTGSTSIPLTWALGSSTQASRSTAEVRTAAAECWGLSRGLTDMMPSNDGVISESSQCVIVRDYVTAIVFLRAWLGQRTFLNNLNLIFSMQIPSHIQFVQSVISMKCK